MKITTFLILVGCLQVSAAGNAQKVSLSFKNAPLNEIFASLEKQTNYTFFCEYSLLQRARKITINVKDIPFKDALDRCLKNQPLTYSFLKNTILIEPINEGIETSNLKTIRNLIDVRGRVVNEYKNPIEGVNVTVKGTTNGTATDKNGEFSLQGIDHNAVLIFTSINVETFEVKVNGKSFIDIALRTKVAEMQEVIINKGYYSEKRRFSTGNVGQVSGQEIENSPVGNPLLTIAGRVPGVTVTQTTGFPGAGVVVQIQGKNSIGNFSYPLYVIDGVPFFSQNPGTTIGGSLGNGVLGKSDPILGSQGNPLSYVNSADIESIEVLKDADATAIFGSRAANGAILITTKKGKAGKMKLDLNIQQGWGKVSNFLDLLNTPEYLAMRHEGMKNDNAAIRSSDYDLNGLWDTTRYTDWQRTLIGGTAKFNQYNATISGGTTNVQYLVGGTFRRETTVFPGDFSNRAGTIHFNINALSADQKFKFQLSNSFTQNKSNLPGLDLTQFIFFTPVAPSLYNADGTLNWMPDINGRSSWVNPIAPIYNLYENETNSLVSNAVLSYEILPRLEIKSNVGYTSLQSDEFTGNLINSLRPEDRQNYVRSSAFSDNSAKSWIIEPQLNYSGNIWKGKMALLVGGSIQRQNNDGKQIIASGQPNDQSLKSTSAATRISSFGEEMFDYKYAAVFARLNYVFREKYILNATARRDGSSRYGSKSRFHNFGSLGFAWIFSEEKYLEKALRFLNYGKLRGSYGTTGNDQIGDYQYLNLYSIYPLENSYQGVNSLIPLGHTNPYIQWEVTKKLQVGIDLGFLKDRIHTSATYTRNRSSNQVLAYNLPTFTGFPGVISNFPALLENSSWEFTLNGTIIKDKNFHWSSSLNLTIPRNEVVNFPGLETSSYRDLLVIGQPVGITKTYPFHGVDPTTGQYFLKDSHGNPTLSRDDSNKTVIINPFAPLYGGLYNSWNFFGFELEVLIQFHKQKGFDFLDQATARGATPGFFFSGKGNQTKRVLHRWQKPGDITDVERYSSNRSVRGFAGDLAYRDISFLRFKTVSLAYVFKADLLKKFSIRSMKIYMNAQNLFTITHFHGLDPENQSVSTLPPLRMITAGIQVGL